MRLLCADATNPQNRASPGQLRSLGVDGVRIVLLPDPALAHYVAALSDAGFSYAVVAASESFAGQGGYGTTLAGYAETLHQIQDPVLWLIGNEPEGTGIASWGMTPDDYAAFWNEAVPALRTILPDAPCFVGGLMDPAWFAQVAPLLTTPPDGLDFHYTPDVATLEQAMGYSLPLSQMEWCDAGRGVATADVVGWQQTLDGYCTHSAWFSYGYGGYMALVSPSGKRRKAWYDYHLALLPGVLPS